jgi:hypothetical protein
VTSPFSLLAAALGGSGGGDGGAGSASGEDLAFVDFDPGDAQLGAAARKKLDTLAKALADRPGIKIGLASRENAQRDLQALKRAALMQKVMEAKRAALAAGGKAAPGEAAITVAPDEYPRYLKLVFEREIAKPEAKEAAEKASAAKEGPPKAGAPKQPTVEQMEARLLERIEIAPEALAALALRRREEVKGYLVGTGHLPAERVLLATAPAAESTPADATRPSRVEFTLQ